MKSRSCDIELDKAEERGRSEKAVFYKVPSDDNGFTIQAYKPSVAMLLQKRMHKQFIAVG